MRDSVRDAFIDFTIPLEGARPGHVGIPWMYQDVLGLVSTGLGNLIDPIGLALPIPWKRSDGTLATRGEIMAEWQRIKTQPPNAKGQTAAQLGHLYARTIATLHLTNDDILGLIKMRLDSNEALVRSYFPEWETWPADAQLATHSMAWACGAGIFSPKAGRAHWPKLTAALHALDFRSAAIECFMPQEAKIGGLRPRNKANRILYNNAAVALHRLDPEVLFYPQNIEGMADSGMSDGTAGASGGGVPVDTPTTPVLVPEARPDPLGHVETFAKVRGPVPFGRPELDADLPTTEPDEDA